MAKGSTTDTDTDAPTDSSASGIGNKPQVDADSMKASNRVVTSAKQAIQITDQDIKDARLLIKNARRITANKQGAPPYNPIELKKQGKHMAKRNISTRFLQKELNRAAPRLFMPILTASTLTAAALPSGWPRGQEKTQFFRNTMTTAIRSWRKNDMFWRGLKMELVDFGFTFAAFTNRYEWRPHLCRMDRGFVPKGTEVMDDKIARFTLKWDYRPDELLEIVREATDAGSEKWNKDAVAMAVDAATRPTMPGDMSQLRKWEEMIREQVVDFSSPRAQRMIETRHFFVLEFSGKVSHYILYPNGKQEDAQILFEDLDAYDSMDQVVIPQVFGYGDGTIHGSWGCGQLLFDLALQVEKLRCDSMDNLLNSNKARLQVANAKDAASVQLVVNDTMIIATGAQWAQNVGGIAGKPDGYIALDDKTTQWAQEIVGNYLPPIPLQPSDIKAAQVNAAQRQQEEVAKDNLESSLKQDALVIAEMIRRMLDPESDDEFAQGIRAKLLGDGVGWFKKTLGKLAEKFKTLEKIIPPMPIALTEEEIEMLVNQPVVQSVTEFTEWAASQRAQFAASVQGNPLFKQDAVARYQAAGVPSAGADFVDSIVVPEGDTTTQTAATREQLLENNAMMTGVDVPVVVTDPHYIHWQALIGPLEQAIQAGMIPAATAGLKHASGHFSAGVAQKSWPPDKINESKATLGRLQRALEAKQQEIAQAQAQQQMQQGQRAPGAVAPVVPIGAVG